MTTPAKRLDYNLGDEFIIVDSDSRTYARGLKVKLEWDDGTDFPRFEIVEGGNEYYGTGDTIYVRLNNIKKMIKPTKKQTPFEAAGYTPEDTFLVTADNTYYKRGMTVQLERDDHSGCPKFKILTGKTGVDATYIYLNDLEKIVPATKPKEDLEFKIRVLQKENEFLVRIINKLTK